MVNKFCWVYYDTKEDQLVLVQKAHRRSTYKMMGVQLKKPNGKVGFFYMAHDFFKTRFTYVGGLNTTGRPKRNLGKSPLLGMEYVPSSQMIDDPYEHAYQSMMED